MKTLKEHFSCFDDKFASLTHIDKEFYEREIGVVAYCSKANVKDTKNNFSEEYLRARLVWSLIQSGKYQKEYICVEFKFPKGNSKTPLKPDVVVFKNKTWLEDFNQSDFKKIRQNLLVIFEGKKNSKTIEKAIENQLRSAMTENTSDERIFGVYFDDSDGFLIFKKTGNSEIKRFYEDKEITQDGLSSWNVHIRDSFSDLPSQKDFIQNNESISDLTKLTLNSLDAIDETNFSDFINSLKRANDRIRPKTAANNLIVEFLTLKVFDEKRSKQSGHTLQFYILPEEKRRDGLAEESFRKRITKLQEDAKREYKEVLSKPFFSYSKDYKPSDSNDERFLIALAESFQKRAILKAKNESFNQIIFNNFAEDTQKAEKGQFFTPIPVVKTIIKMLNPMAGEELCDPCCGICDFPAMAFRHSYRKAPEYPPIAGHFYGFDLENSNLKLAELNLVLNGDGGATLRQMNSLSQKLLADNSNTLREGEFTSSNFTSEWSHKSDPDKELKKFKIIATNPPFGKGRDLKTGDKGNWDLSKETISLYDTWDIKIAENGKKPNSMDMGVLFLENAYKLLEEGGRLGIVLSNSIASIKEWENVRKWLVEKMRIVAVFDLPANTFGETGVATTVIIAYKPRENEKKLLSNNYEVFIKEVENIGYEVKTVNRSIEFKPQFVIDENTFERTEQLEEDFTDMLSEFKEYLQRQEEEIKEAFHLDSFEVY
jgi:type I restriction enzyme M protein